MLHVYLLQRPHLQGTVADTTLSFLPEDVGVALLQKKELDDGGNKQPENIQGIDLSKQCGLRRVNSPVLLKISPSRI